MVARLVKANHVAILLCVTLCIRGHGVNAFTFYHIKSAMLFNFFCNLRAYNITFFCGFQSFYLRQNIY